MKRHFVFAVKFFVMLCCISLVMTEVIWDTDASFGREPVTNLPQNELLFLQRILGGRGCVPGGNAPSASAFAVTQKLASLRNASHVRVFFRENRGQLADCEGGTQYIANVHSTQVHFRKQGVSIMLSTIPDVGALDLVELDVANEVQLDPTLSPIRKCTRVDLLFDGANEYVTVEGVGQLSGVSNYYLAHCPDGITGVRDYRRLRYRNLYDQIDLEYFEMDGHLKYNIIVHPGGNVSDIRLRYEGIEALSIDDEGRLLIRTALGDIRESIPITYQEDEGKATHRQLVASEYVVNGSTVMYRVNDYDPSKDLVIDPWATYYGGSEIDFGYGIDTDSQGGTVITGWTYSYDLRISPGAVQTVNRGGNENGFDAFIARYDRCGNRMWSTYYGGTGRENAYGAACDRDDNVVVGGYTYSTDFPVESAYQPSLAGDTADLQPDAYVVKLDASGRRLWATYFGGSTADIATGGVAVGQSGNIYLGGYGWAGNDFPVTPGAQQETGNGVLEMFIAKFSPNGSLLWCTLFGGDGYEFATGLTLDSAENPILCGCATGGTYLPGTTGSFQPGISGEKDALVVKHSSAGKLQWATYYGGSHDDCFWGVGTDNNGNVLLCGESFSDDFPVSATAFQSTKTQEYASIIVSLDAAGGRNWATYLDGSDGHGTCWGITADRNNDVFYAGWTTSTDYPVRDAMQQENRGVFDIVVGKLTGTGELIWATYYGGNGLDQAWDAAITSENNLVVTGATRSSNLPVLHSEQTLSTPNDLRDAFLLHLTPTGHLHGPLLLAADTIDFGMIPLGHQRDSTIMVVLSNENMDPLSIVRTELIGPDRTQFELINGTAPFSLNPGEPHDFIFRFAPTEDGTLHARLVIDHDGACWADTVELIGVGAKPVAAFRTREIDFGPVFIGDEKDTTVSALLTNAGPVNLEIVEVRQAVSEHVHFQVLHGGSPVSIPPGDSLKVELRFSPTINGQISGTLEFHYEGSTVPDTLWLRGEGVQEAPAAAVLGVDTIWANVGDIIEVPIRLVDATELDRSGITSFRSALWFNSTVLAPRDGLPISDVTLDTRSISLNDIPISFVSGEQLMMLRFQCMLGDEDGTALTLHNTVALGGVVDITEVPGYVGLLDVCRQGGDRLFEDTGTLALAQNRPNPFNATTIIEYELIEAGPTTLCVLDMLGRIVAVPQDGIQLPGRHTVHFDASALPSGSYVYVLTTRTGSAMRQLQVMK